MTDRRDSCCDGELLRADLSDHALKLALVGFAALWRGHSVPPDELLNGGFAEVVEVQAANGRLEIDERGHLVGIHGLTLRTTRHRFEHAGRAHHTWCALDCIGIPAALSLDATAHTTCPTCDRPLAVEISRGYPQDDGLMLWVPAPPGGNLMAEFCATADLYCSLDHLQKRIDIDATPGSASALDAAAALGRDIWADVAGLDLAANA